MVTIEQFQNLTNCMIALIIIISVFIVGVIIVFAVWVTKLDHRVEKIEKEREIEHRVAEGIKNTKTS